MARILLTGGRGMVGRNIQAHPSAAHHEIVAPTSADLDLTNETVTTQFMADVKPDVVIHGAGRVGGIQANIADPVGFLDDNMMMGRNVVMAAWKSGVPTLLNLASSCMYPRAAPNPLREDMILTGELEPTNEGYALAKIMTTRLCQYIQRQEPQVSYKTLIPCNLYGEHDKFDPKHSHLIAAIIHKMHMAKITESPQVELWGDGSVRREFMYASDLADAVFHAIQDMRALPELMNVGLGYDFSILEYYEKVASIVGWKGHFEFDLTKPVGMKQKLCDVSALENWGWTAPTSLQDGLAKTYKFYLERAV